MAYYFGDLSTWKWPSKLVTKATSVPRRAYKGIQSYRAKVFARNKQTEAKYGVIGPSGYKHDDSILIGGGRRYTTRADFNYNRRISTAIRRGASYIRRWQRKPYMYKRRRYARRWKSYGRGRYSGAGRRKRYIPMKSRGYLRSGGAYKRFGSGGELKFYDVQQAATTVNSGGDILKTHPIIAQGTGQSQRIGRKVTIRKWMFQGHIILPKATDAALTYDMIRIMVVLDKQANGAALTGTDDFLSGSNHSDFRKLTETNRFRLLYDKRIFIQNGGGGGNGTTEDYAATMKPVRIYLNVNVPMEYSSTAGAITEIRSNNIVLAAITHAGILQIYGRIRMRFSDT